MRLIELLKTSTFRLAVFFSLAVTLSTSIVFVVICWQVSAFNINRVGTLLSTEIASAVAEPAAWLKESLDLRLTRDLRRIDYAAIFHHDGKLVYGNIAAIPAGLPIDGKAHAVDALATYSPNRVITPGLFAAALRSDGDIIVFGCTLYEISALRHLVFESLLIGLGPAILLALIVAVIFSFRSARRLMAINQKILRIMRGDLNERLPTGDKDDVDYVATAVNVMLDEIVRLLEQIRSVGDNIAHDLRTPLAVARTRLERALEKNDGEGLHKTASQTLADLDRALTTVTALLRISDIESGRHRSHFRTVDLAEICANVFDLYEPLAEAKVIPLSLDAPAPVLILGDFDLLIEAVANLVDNAIKFTPSGKPVSIMARMIGDRPVIRIADRGPGIAPKDRAQIFKRFYRAERDRRLPGNGLGLSMAAIIAERHGLAIHVGDNGPGAIFEISPSIPASQEVGDAENAHVWVGQLSPLRAEDGDRPHVVARQF